MDKKLTKPNEIIVSSNMPACKHTDSFYISNYQAGVFLTCMKCGLDIKLSLDYDEEMSRMQSEEISSNSKEKC